MNAGKTFLFATTAAGAVAAVLITRSCSDAHSDPVSRHVQFPPQTPPGEPVDPNELFKDKETASRFAPKEPELAFVERSEGLPTSGTWRGYPLLHDFNGDGRADLVASNREEDGYNVWAATAAGPWLRSIDGPRKGEGGLPRDMQYGPARAADVDGDGRDDLLVSAHSDALRLYRNVLATDADGKPVEQDKLHWLRTTQPIDNPFLMLDIATGDVNGDKKVDVVGIGHFKGGFGVYIGDGKGGMQRLPESAQIIDTKTFGSRVELVDLDGDGHDDIVANTNRGQRVYITHPGTPYSWEDRSAGLPNPKIGNSITGQCVGHFTGSKSFEIASCLVPDPMVKPELFDTIGVYAWDAEKKSWSHVDKGLPRNEVYRDLACADFNADGNLDLLVLSLESGGVFYLGDGKGGFHAKGRLPGIYGVGRIATGDIDGDNLVDIVISIPATKEHPEWGGLRAFVNRAELWK